MARDTGTFNIAANLEVLVRAPLDARAVAGKQSDLINPTTWADAQGNTWLYKGMIVSVASDPSILNNGLYFLKDETTYTDIDSWLQIDEINPTEIDGTSSVTFQLNNNASGVLLKDASGYLELINTDASVFAGLKAGDIEIDSLKIDNLNGALYVQDGSVFSISEALPLFGYEGSLTTNGITHDFTVDHSLNTLRQTMSVYEGASMIYPELERGLNTNIIKFIEAPLAGAEYDIIIFGF